MQEKEVTQLDTPGELRVKGAAVFREYLNRPKGARPPRPVSDLFLSDLFTTDGVDRHSRHF